MHWKFLLFNPQGFIALQERNTILLVLCCMAALAIPFFITLIYIVRKYRADNNLNNSTYQPESSGNATKQIMLWIPGLLLVIVLSVITWRSTHAVDPFKPINSVNPPITIDVVALQWKWLFIYPDQNIATVNFVEFPENTPINFVLTADAPTNSFSIPELGGQMYAMSAMTTQLHLIADHTGEFRGQAAEISGPGFSGMNFIAKSVSNGSFQGWIESLKTRQTDLTQEEYATLAKPSMNNSRAFYASVDAGLFDSIVGKYMYMDKKDSQ